MKRFIALMLMTGSLFANSNVYFDTGAFNPWNFLVWSNPDNSEVLNTNALDSYLDSLFSSFASNQYDGIYFAFTQISDIDYLDAPEMWKTAPISPSDVYIRNLLMQIYENCPAGSMETFLNTFISKAHQYGVKVYLSFGGEAADGMKICPNQQNTPAEQATTLANYLTSYHFDGVDFDLESNAIQQSNTSDEINEFFGTLKTLATQNSFTSILTVMGDLSWSTVAGSPVDHFDTIQLMLYGSGGPGGKYYIDAENVTWGISEWINILGKENAGMISIGFQDDTYYEDPSASAGKIYTVDPTNRGVSAAMIYEELLQDLAALGYSESLGEYFWWPSIGVKGATGKDRYSVGPNYAANFLSQPMVDFAHATKAP